MAKSGRQLSLSAASIAGYNRLSKCVLIAATICPPAEKPSTPILCGSICHREVLSRGVETKLGSGLRRDLLLCLSDSVHEHDAEMNLAKELRSAETTETLLRHQEQ